MSAARTQRFAWLVGLLAVLLLLGLVTVRTGRAPGPHEGVRGAAVVPDGAATPTRSAEKNASSGLLAPFTPVLDAVVTALTGSGEDAQVGRCVPSSWDNAARHAPNRTIMRGVAPDVDRTRDARLSETPGTSASDSLPC